MKRIREAVTEIRSAARKDPVLGAEGAVLLLEKISPAIEQVDGSSGSIGTAVDRAIESLVPIIAGAPAAEDTRDEWLDRLWMAFLADNMPYLGWLGEFWGELCVTPERATHWADNLLPGLRANWARSGIRYYQGTDACLSSLVAAGRFEEVLDVLELDPHQGYTYYGVQALAGLDRVDDALEYAQRKRGPFGASTSRRSVVELCETILLEAGRNEEAYELLALAASFRSTRLATYRAILAKYPDRDPAEVLTDLVARTPGKEGSWFATARRHGHLELALDLARRSACDPRTLSRAARDHLLSEPEFAMECGVLSLHWVAEGEGYKIELGEVQVVRDIVLQAAEALGRSEGVLARFREIAQRDVSERKLMRAALAPLFR
ncbi:MAG: hypothetical protein ABFS86_18960 [Planctomycetota bacterium]